MTKARFIYDSAYKNADLYYATRFTTFDPLVYFEYKNKKYLIVDDLEYDRAKKYAKADEVLLASRYRKELELRKGNVIEIMDIILNKLGIKTLEVPPNFPLSLAEKFKSKKYKLSIGTTPFYPSRVRKEPFEKKALIEIQKNNFRFFALVEKTLRQSKIKGNKLYFKNKPLTSEFLKELVYIEALRLGCEMPYEPIIACGEYSIDPHESGRGIIKPHEAIIVDIFPKSKRTFYFGDATRTFCRGKAPEKLKKLYLTVKKGQEMAIASIKSGINGKKIHEKVINFFESQGYKTGEMGGRLQGFIHGTGHGIGLELHETPSINRSDCKLKEGHVTSVEPGLYYKNIGGVRIEDLVYVTKNGCEILSGYPKRLEIL